MDEVKNLTTTDQVKTFSDPFRYRILKTFYKMKKPATVKEIAVDMNSVPANVHYHVKKMEKAGILQLIYTKEINGIIAKYYEPTAETFNIECSEEVAESSKKIILAESQKMIAQLYEESKNAFIEQLNRNSKGNEKLPATVSEKEIFLTDAEAQELAKYIKDFIEKHENSHESLECISKYNCFFSIFKVK